MPQGPLEAVDDVGVFDVVNTVSGGLVDANADDGKFDFQIDVPGRSRRSGPGAGGEPDAGRLATLNVIAAAPTAIPPCIAVSPSATPP